MDVQKPLIYIVANIAIVSQKLFKNIAVNVVMDVRKL